MTQSKFLFRNWEHQNITFQHLIDLDFPLPKFELDGEISYPIEEFNVNGLQAVAFGTNPPDLTIQ